MLIPCSTALLNRKNDQNSHEIPASPSVESVECELKDSGRGRAAVPNNRFQSCTCIEQSS